MNKKFKSLYITEEEGGFKRNIIEREIDSLPEGEVIIKVKFSSLNYKDALSANGNKGVTRKYPHTPGIDASGIVEYSSCDDFKIGDEVLVTGYDLGMNTSGGFSEYIRVPSSWVVRLPKDLSLKEAMDYGTAGFTAALSVYKFINSVDKDMGDVLVTGGTGGVAVIAAKILIKLGYSVVVSTGKLEGQKDVLLNLGVKDIIHRSEVDDNSGRPLLRPRWAGVIDTVGGNTLSTAIKTTNYCGAVTTCGNAGGIEFTSSVYPFILKGVTLYGIDSVECPMNVRLKIWDLLSNEWKLDDLDDMVNVVSLEELNNSIDLIMAGKHVGRTVVDLEKM
ncbi:MULTISPECIES: YhdH/YhfP family quinone oxidoreductase [Clostridioides]|uniref:YhdH/YhfP family quinone oxidoreductase n=1 Tax=Clostridioides sp. ZZV14-6387 TaxID=2811497 RepID=UPI0007BAE9DB|nr:YhdH/YhfP family quinone oxidoreductase [Clostridioides sp. ZZV14-6387]CZR98433.1 Putative quinone oxidoreductase YhfP [Clostridioides difficile]CZS10489.1 Putative quinone oxidoreductase YhfP [Clostridioides difficile]